jgi:hypothetical protein
VYLLIGQRHIVDEIVFLTSYQERDGNDTTKGEQSGEGKSLQAVCAPGNCHAETAPVLLK